MEVSGTNKSIYFDADTFCKAELLIEKQGTDSLSQLVRGLISEKFDKLGLKMPQKRDPKDC